MRRHSHAWFVVAVAAYASGCGAPARSTTLDLSASAALDMARGAHSDDGGGVDGSSGGDLALYTPPNLTPILQALADKAKSVTPSVAGTSGYGLFDVTFAVEWLATGQKWDYRGTVPHQSGSSPKWIWAAAALHNNMTAADLTRCVGPTFEYSCNNTAGSFIDHAGGIVAVNAFTQKVIGNSVDDMTLCYWSTDITRTDANCGKNICNYDYNGEACGDNYFTANGALKFLDHVWKRDLLPPDKAQLLLDWSTLTPRTGYSGWVGTQLPAAIRAGDFNTCLANPKSCKLHHKPGALGPGCCGSVGYEYNWINEIAIVEAPRGPYAVVTMMAHAGDWCQEIATTEYASCVIYHALMQDTADPFGAPCTTDKNAHPESCKEVPEVCPASSPGNPPACN